MSRQLPTFCALLQHLQRGDNLAQSQANMAWDCGPEIQWLTGSCRRGAAKEAGEQRHHAPKVLVSSRCCFAHPSRGPRDLSVRRIVVLHFVT